MLAETTDSLCNEKVFDTSTARWLTIAHGMVGCSLVFVATHLLLWSWPRKKRYFQRLNACQRFSKIAVGLYLATFLLGSLSYPNYRVHKRAAFLDNPTRVGDSVLLHNELTGDELSVVETVDDAGKVARWFDVKEHWAVFAGLLSILVFFSLRSSNRDNDPLIFTAIAIHCGLVWATAIMGFYTASHTYLL